MLKFSVLCVWQGASSAANGVFHHGGSQDAKGGSLSWHAERLPKRGSTHGRVRPSQHRETPRLVCFCVSVCVRKSTRRSQKHYWRSWTHSWTSHRMTSGAVCLLEGERNFKNRCQNAQRERKETLLVTKTKAKQCRKVKWALCCNMNTPINHEYTTTQELCCYLHHRQGNRQ